MTRSMQTQGWGLPGAGDPAPGFLQRTTANPRFSFDSAAGRYLVLCFFGSGADAHTQAALGAVHARPDIFDDDRACFFGVSTDPEDEARGRVTPRVPGYRHFWDFDLSVSRLYGIAGTTVAAGPAALARHWIVIDPTMRVLATIPFRSDRSDLAQVIALLDALPPPDRFAGEKIMAPIPFLPRVLEPDLCRRLIGLYEAQGGEESGFMREIRARTLGMTDPAFKRRKDYTIEDPGLVDLLKARISRRVVPEVVKVHQFDVTRMER